MICIGTGLDVDTCACGVCVVRRGAYRCESVPAVAPRRRPCPTGIPSNGRAGAYVPSRCADRCTCCEYCRGALRPVPAWCACPLPSLEQSNCERGHSTGVECVGGCKPRPIAKAIVVGTRSRLGRVVSFVRRWLGRQRAPD